MGNNLFENPQLVHFKMDDLYERAFAYGLAQLTVIWGCIEHQLFLLVFYSDETRGAEFTEKFFGPTAIPARQKIAEDQIEATLKSSYPEFIDQLQKAFDLFEDVRERRNRLVHGLWSRNGAKSFSVIPLRLESKTNRVISKPVPVDLQTLASLERDIDFLMQRLAGLGTEMMAFKWLEEAESRRTHAQQKTP